MLTVSEDGTAQGLHSELLPFHELGTVKIERWSNIEFNNSTGQWEVQLLQEEGRIGFSHKLRSACINWEHEYYKKQMESV